MKTFTKIAVGAAIAGATLFGAVAPASAQTPGTATGVLNAAGYVLGTWTPGAVPASGPGATVILPAVGSTGPISQGSLCLQYTTAGVVTAESCVSGAANQQFKAERSADGTRFSLNAINNPAAVQRMTVSANSTEATMTLNAYSAAGTPWMFSDITDSHSIVTIDGASGGLEPTFSGKGEPGESVEVRAADGTLLATAVVDVHGNWSAKSTVTLLEQEYKVTASQNDGTDTSTFDLTFTVVGAPIADPLVAGGVATVLLAAAGVFFASKRRQATTTAA